MADKVDAVVAQSPLGPVVVVAHSLGAVPVAMAVSARRLHASHVVLLEPALYDIARGHEAIERHITTMTRARHHAESGNIFGFWQEFSELMFGRPANPETWDADRPIAERFASLDTPWGHDTDISWVADVPTLVLTGGWNQEYEVIADRLSQAGARHRHLGSSHRPQDHPEFEAVLAGFIT